MLLKLQGMKELKLNWISNSMQKGTGNLLKKCKVMFQPSASDNSRFRSLVK